MIRTQQPPPDLTATTTEAHAESDAPVCDGDGGSVFTYEGPQFGAHIEEEPCRKCGGWHESPGERESRLRWENRRRPIRDLIRRLRRTCVTPPAGSDS